MGQFYSTAGNGCSPDEERTEAKTDYYELLGVESHAADEEIKKAYRRKALELHPDRNYGNTESATQLFAEVQAAYEVLSDPQERAWYDSHRHAFPAGGGGPENEDYSYNIRMTSSDDIFKLFTRFSPRMEFSDAPTGFYGGLRDTFERLALEEKIACQWDNLEFDDYPTFGCCDDDVEVIRPFYSAWTGFSTKKSFAWKDIYRYSEAPDRRVRRLMEKENRRLRDESIREFNDAVRSLVAFAKKRDPRYKANAQNEAQRQETLRQLSADQAARSRAANKAKLRDHVIPDWAKSEVLLDETDTSLSEEELEHFECVVCRKSFKNPRQLEAHERSKKHIRAVKQLRWEMKAQDRHLGLGPTGSHQNIAREADQSPSLKGDGTESMANSSADGVEIIDRNAPGLVNCETGTSMGDTEDSVAIPDNNTSPVDDLETSTSGVYDDESDYASRESVERQLHTATAPHHPEPGPPADTFPGHGLSSEFTPETTEKLGKAKQKRNKKAAQRATGQPSELSCSTCKASFPSRTQLFSHIRDLGHAQPLAKPIKQKRR